MSGTGPAVGDTIDLINNKDDDDISNDNVPCVTNDEDDNQDDTDATPDEDVEMCKAC